MFGRFRVDGYCCECSKETTFTSDAKIIGYQYSLESATPSDYENGFFSLTLICGRNGSHKQKYYFLMEDDGFCKIGQYPSLADIALNETKEYRSLLSDENSQEFHKAIGLAAHGVGVGSYAYLRRIFERLVYECFEDHKEENKWSQDDFYRMRMDEKIGFLKQYLPEFLVENKKVYSILSDGIHNLTEEQCLSFFSVLKMSILVILEQEKEEKKKQDLKATLEQEIVNYEKE